MNSGEPPGRQFIEVEVTGMSCASCAASLQKSLMAKLDFEVEVHFGLGVVRMPESKRQDWKRVVAEIRNGGFDVVSSDLAFVCSRKTEGEPARFRARTLGKELENMVGVESVKVSGDGVLVARILGGLSDVSQLEAEAFRSGFEVLGEDELVHASSAGNGGVGPAVLDRYLDEFPGEIPEIPEPEPESASPGSSGAQGAGGAGDRDMRGLSTAGRQKREEYRRALVRFWWAMALSLPFMVEMMLMMAGFEHHGLMPGWVQFVLATLVEWWLGWRFFSGGYTALKRGGANMDVLIAGGTGVAWAYSTWALACWYGRGAEGHGPQLYFEASAMVVTLVLLGKYLEARARAKTGEALEALMQGQPRTARVRMGDGSWANIPVGAIEVGAVVQVRNGEQVPVDGVVMQGLGAVDESLMSGESVPRGRQAGDWVYAGTLLVEGALVIESRRLGKHTQLAEMIRLVREAQSSRAPVQKMADRISGYFVPAVLVIALVTVVVNGLITGNWEEAIIRGVAVMVIACPCALGLATPVTVIVGVGCGAREGLLFRNAIALEKAAAVGVVILDKTGTLTRNRPEVKAVEKRPGVDPGELLVLAARVESGSSHPLAKAIVEYAVAHGQVVELKECESHEVIAGKGVVLRKQGENGQNVEVARAGALDWLLGAMTLETGERDDLSKQFEDLAGRGMSVVAVSRDQTVLGLIGLSDEIRSQSGEAVRRLADLGVRVILVTGDNRNTAQAVARKVGIPEVQYGITPAGKAEYVKELKAKGNVVAMAGDGVNDAPALSHADVSYAMGLGSDTAREAADVTLLRDDLTGIAGSMALSRKVIGKIRQNLFFAFVFNVLGIPLAAIGMLTPVIAGMAMVASSLSVVLNALALRKWKSRS